MTGKELVILFNNCEEYLNTNIKSFTEITTSFYNELRTKLTMKILLLTVHKIP
jgi:hypothetical protein